MLFFVYCYIKLIKGLLPFTDTRKKLSGLFFKPRKISYLISFNLKDIIYAEILSMQIIYKV